MPRVAQANSSNTAKARTREKPARRKEDALSIAQEQGLLAGGRTLTIRGRMPSLLVEQAKRKTGIQADSKLLEVALASIVVADDYAGAKNGCTVLTRNVPASICSCNSIRVEQRSSTTACE